MKEQVAIFFRQVGRSFACGVPLLKALETIYLETEDVNWKSIVLDILESMQIEPSFSLALKNSGANFSPSLLGMVQACEDNGRLDSGLEDIAKALEESVILPFFEESDTKDIDEEMGLTYLFALFDKNQPSDIHILPQSESYEIKFRINGLLVSVDRLSKDLGVKLVTNIKRASCLHLDITNLPQDGRIRVKHNNESLDLRLSVLPTVLGEKVTLRVLNNSNIILEPERIFTNQDDLAQFNELINIPFGMVLFCGPTGSGKTTTLYTAVNEFAKREVLSVSSIEDPVEYVLPGVSQVLVDTQSGLNFAAGIRSILRSDPDVVCVGEVRNEEVFSLMNKTALTGHLVLSTMHTADCLSTIEKLLEIGVDSFSISTALSGLVCQRLVRSLCTKCMVKETVSKNVALEFDLEEGSEICSASGCDSCNQTGYRGRVAVYEFLKINKEVKDMIREKDMKGIADYIDEKEYYSMRDRGVQLVKEHRSSLEEVIRQFSQM
ncbi:MAG: Flp pilus assembly complex ATPase component TadA [Candidatus Cloacimonetes bacterium]|nr:Flp pilus assembly complex ATPase component TadA [Candidatus Cloacimonadota bacterium]